MKSTETATANKTATADNLLLVSSEAFEQGKAIPSRYTCQGEDINPPIDIAELPVATKSLAIMVEDPDAPKKTWLHWSVWNIPVTKHIKENEIPGLEGRNDFGKNSYGGPCPPSGTHRYYFRIFALDTMLKLEQGASRKELEKAMKKHIIARGELLGLYGKA